MLELSTFIKMRLPETKLVSVPPEALIIKIQ